MWVRADDWVISRDENIFGFLHDYARLRCIICYNIEHSTEIVVCGERFSLVLALPNYRLNPIVIANYRSRQTKSVFMEATMVKEKEQVSDTPWMRSEEAADYLGVCVGTIRNWVSQKRIPFVRRGRIVRFQRKDLDKWLRNGGTRSGGVTS